MGLAGLAAVLLLLIGLVFVGRLFLTTDSGRAWLAAAIESMLASETQQVEIGRITGDPLSQARILDVRLADPDGVWMDVAEIRLDWDPWRLLSRTLAINDLRVTGVTVTRQPASGPEKSEPAGGLVPRLPVDLRVEAFRIDNVNLMEEAVGTSARLEARGAIYTGTDGLRLNLVARRTDTVEAGLKGDIIFDPASGALLMDVRLDAPAGGVLSTLSGFPGKPELALRLQGDGTVENWRGALVFRVGQARAAELDLSLARAETLDLRVAGRIDPRSMLNVPILDAAYNTAGRFRVEGGRLVVDTLTIDGAPALMRIFGTVDPDRPALDLTFDLHPRDMAAVNAMLDPVALGDTRLDGRLSGPLSDLALSLNIFSKRFQAPGVTGQDVFLALMGQQRGHGFALRGSGGFGKLLAPDVALEAAPGITFDGFLPGDMSSLTIESAGITSTALRIDVSGDVPLKAGTGLRLAVESTLAPGEPGGADVVARFLRRGVTASALLVQESETSPLHLSEIAVDHPWLQLTGNVRFADGVAPLADIYVETRDLAALGEALEIEARGRPVTARATVTGTWDRPALDLALEGSDLALGGVDLRNLQAHLAARQMPDGNRDGTVVFTADTDIGQATVDSGFSLPASGERLILQDLSVKGEPGTLAGDLAIPLGGAGVITGRLGGTLAAGPMLRRQTGLALAGELAVSLELSARNGDQAASLKIDGKDAFIGPARLTSASVDIHQADRETGYSMSLAGYYKGETTLRTAGRIARTAEQSEFVVEELKAQVGPRAIALEAPFRLVRSGTRLEIAPVSLAIGEGQAEIAVTMLAERMAATARFREIPLDLVDLLDPPVGVGGTLSGEARLEAEDDAAAGRARIDFSGVSLTGGTAEVSDLNGSVAGEWNGRRLKLSGVLDDDRGTRLALEAALPLEYRSVPIGLTFPPEARLEGKLLWQGEVSPFWQSLGLETHLLSGRADGTLAISGTLADPVLRGGVTLEGGVYRNIDFGTILRDLALDIEIAPKEATIESLRATDGHGGTLTASGSVRYGGGAGTAADIRLTLEKMRVVSRPEIDARASGSVRYRLDGGNADISGRVTTDEVEARLVNQLPTEVITLDVVEVPGPIRPIAVTPASQEDRTITNLDLRIEAPRRAFVRGRGLDSEWQGNLDLAGTVEAPQISGNLHLVRGVFDFAGRRFQLTRGDVQFTGSDEIDPLLDITAEHDTKTIRAFVNISGRASEPRVVLTSDPGLPEDEIVSRVLFGTSVTELSALEAVQLAAAIRQLSSGGVGGIVGTTRQALGLDVLAFGQGEDGGTTVRGGKYLTENIYVEIQSGTAPGSDQLSVEVQVTPSISVESEIRQDTGSNIGVFWKRDY